MSFPPRFVTVSGKTRPTFSARSAQAAALHRQWWAETQAVRQRQMQLEVAGGRAETWRFLAKPGLDSQKNI